MENTYSPRFFIFESFKNFSNNSRNSKKSDWQILEPGDMKYVCKQKLLEVKSYASCLSDKKFYRCRETPIYDLHNYIIWPTKTAFKTSNDSLIIPRLFLRGPAVTKTYCLFPAIPQIES